MLLLAGCASDPAPYNINVLHDLGSDVSTFRTWAWVEGSALRTGDPRFDDAFIDACVRAAVERELSARGLAGAAPEDAEVLFEYRVSIEGGVGEFQEFNPGDAAIIAWDTSDGEAAWVATVHGQIVVAMPREERREQIDQWVARLFREFRPLGAGDGAPGER